MSNKKNNKSAKKVYCRKMMRNRLKKQIGSNKIQ